MELRVDNIPFLVNDFSLLTILNPRVSGSTFHKIPYACSSGSLQPRSLSLPPFFLKVSGLCCYWQILSNWILLNCKLILHSWLVWWHDPLSWQILTDHQHKSFLLVCMQFQFYIFSHFPLQFFSGYSYCRPQKKYLQKHEYTSRGWLAILRNHHLSTIKILRNFGVSLPHIFENRISQCQPWML